MAIKCEAYGGKALVCEASAIAQSLFFEASGFIFKYASYKTLLNLTIFLPFELYHQVI